MARSFDQTVVFPGVSSAELFQTYMTSEKHGAALNAPASIDPKVGGAFSIFGEEGLRGTTLFVDMNRMVIQSWRGQVWAPNDSDSILVLLFEDRSDGGTILLAHVNVPEHAFARLNPDAWNEMYWKRWK